MSTSTQSDKLIKLSAQFLTCKLEDTGYDFSKKKLEDMNTVYQKILKSISMMEKAVSTYATESVSLSKSLLQCTQFFNSSPDIVTNIDSASEIFQKTQEEATKYKKFMHDQLFIPVRSYGEQYIKLLDRFKVCDQRRLLVSYHLKRVEDLSKKSLKKQHGLAIAKDKCEIARDDYDFLRNELVDDVNKLCTDTEKVILPIIRVVLEGAHEMLTRTTEIHTTAPELIENLPSTTSFMNYVIHAFGDSMEKVENVRSKKRTS
ncbi:SH3 domain-containing protein [Entamoeba marina]